MLQLGFIAARVAAVIGMCGAGCIAEAQQAAQPVTVTWSRPLVKAADLLEQFYGRPVTVEDPMRVWRGELDSIGLDRNGAEILRVKQHSLVLPEGVLGGDASALSVALIGRILDAYRQQNPDQARYRVLESPMGFHIVPAEVLDGSGRMGPATSPLDVRISVPTEKRTATEHLEALGKAVTAASGIPVKPFTGWFDEYFAANGYKLPMGGVKAASRPYMLFEWGVSRAIARQALVDLMQRSASTMSWRLDCLPGLFGEEKACMLSITDVKVGPTQRALQFDRCSNCKPIPEQ